MYWGFLLLFVAVCLLSLLSENGGIQQQQTIMKKYINHNNYYYKVLNGNGHGCIVCPLYYLENGMNQYYCEIIKSDGRAGFIKQGDMVTFERKQLQLLDVHEYSEHHLITKTRIPAIDPLTGQQASLERLFLA